MEHKKYRNYILRNYNDLDQLKVLTDEEREAINVVGHVLPFKSNNYVVEELIDWNNVPNDPIFTLTFPRREMLSKKHYAAVKYLLDKKDEAGLKEKVHEIRLKLNPNPAGQQHNVPVIDGLKLHGMQHKYREPGTDLSCLLYLLFPLASVFRNE